MFLVCLTGRGQIIVNEIIYKFKEGDFLFLPWEHNICYKPDENRPFKVLGVHIIPDLKPNTNFNFRSIHYGDKKFQGDIYFPHLQGVIQGKAQNAKSLILLAEYIVMIFERQSSINKKWAREMGLLLLQELTYFVNKPKLPSEYYPESFKQLLEYIEENLTKSIKINDLEKYINCCESTIFRMFKKHLNLTPTTWIQKRKMDYAAELLSTTTLRVGEVAEQIGMNDQYYFSKLFKKYHNINAKIYKKEIYI